MVDALALRGIDAEGAVDGAISGDAAVEQECRTRAGQPAENVAPPHRAVQQQAADSHGYPALNRADITSVVHMVTLPVALSHETGGSTRPGAHGALRRRGRRANLYRNRI